MVIKNNIFLFILLLSGLSGLAQDSSLIAKYTFTTSRNTRSEILIANETKAFYQVLKKSALGESEPKAELNAGDYTITGFKNSTFSNFIFLQNSEKDNYSYLKTQNQELIVFDEMPELKWELINELKQIDKYNCKKAVVDFRGRKFIAWYAPEIPIPFGPFKFKGLPGLIMNIESTYQNSTIYWNLTSIKFDSSLEVPEKNNFKGEDITLREVLTNERDDRNERSKRTITKLGRNIRQTKITIKRLGAERIYEWEAEDEE